MATIVLDESIALSLLDTIQSLMCYWSPNDQYADYECCFCGNRPPTNNGEITHRDDCNGVKNLAALNEALNTYPEESQD